MTRYLIRKSRVNYEKILSGKENTLLLQKNKCVQPGEIVHFVEVENGKRTGRECWTTIQKVYNDRLIQFAIHRTEDRTWNSSKRNGST